MLPFGKVRTVMQMKCMRMKDKMSCQGTDRQTDECLVG